jgi:hypothetical protein
MSLSDHPVAPGRAGRDADGHDLRAVGLGALVGKVARQGDGRSLFKPLGSPPDDPGRTSSG